MTAPLPPPHAGIVLFHPEPEQLDATLRAVLAEAAHVYLFLNAPLSEAARRCVGRHAGPRLSLLGDGGNAGLGVAYNRMAEAARASGATALLLLDQDSSPPPGMIGGLLALRARLAEAGVAVAAVGPRPVAAEGSDTKTPRLFRGAGASPVPGAAPLEFLISSGTLLDLAALERVGGFREDFFIDAVDIEWCFRAWARGFSCWMARDVVMPHRLGRGILRVPVLGLHLAVQPDFRLYAYARNQAAMLGLAHVPLRWKAKLLPYLLVQALAHSLAQRRPGLPGVFLRGVWDGVRGRLGPVGPGR
ncbi:hypothetical protein ACFFMP_16010 [Pseudoroseomonas cervicalis]